MFTIEKNDIKIGEYLKRKILMNYESIRQFCKAYLELRDGTTDNEEIRKLLNRFSQILKGKKRLQIDDLPFITNLLAISCEEILTAGKKRLPVQSHITNYDIASSKNKDVWKRYMEDDRGLFLSSDEYSNTVLDYAFELKNYKFIKYLFNEKHLKLSDEYKRFKFNNYILETDIKKINTQNITSSLEFKINYYDSIRIKVIILAIENEDISMLNKLHARETPIFKFFDYWINQYTFSDLRERDEWIEYLDELIENITFANNNIIDYFSQEFITKNNKKQNISVMFPFLDKLIKSLVENKQYDKAEVVIKRAIEHNKKTLDQLNNLIDEAFECYKKHTTITYSIANQTIIIPLSNEEITEGVLSGFSIEKKYNAVSFNYNKNAYDNSTKRNDFIGLATNVIKVDTDQGTSNIKKLLQELNEYYYKIYNLREERRGEKND